MTPKERAEDFWARVWQVENAGGRYEEIVALIEEEFIAIIAEEREAIASDVHALAFKSENRDEQFLLAMRLIEKRIRNRAYIGAEEVNSAQPANSDR